MANYRHLFEDCSNEEPDLGFSISDCSNEDPDLGFSISDDSLELFYSGRERRTAPSSSVTEYMDYEDLVRATMGESLSFFSSKKPANKEAVEALVKMSVGPAEREMICVVCFNALSSAGSSSSEVIKMPCSHFFHGGCILTWLQDNNDCPLCRLPLLPAEPSTTTQE